MPRKITKTEQVKRLFLDGQLLTREFVHKYFYTMNLPDIVYRLRKTGMEFEFKWLKSKYGRRYGQWKCTNYKEIRIEQTRKLLKRISSK